MDTSKPKQSRDADSRRRCIIRILNENPPMYEDEVRTELAKRGFECSDRTWRRDKTILALDRDVLLCGMKPAEKLRTLHGRSA